MLPLRARVDLGAMAMKGYSTFPKGHSFGGGSYPTAEVQSVYPTAPADWAIYRVKCQTVLCQIIQFSISMLLVLFNP